MSEKIKTPADTSGSSPGAILKRCREYHEISLEEASQTTKIGITYLKSLEDDQVSGFANLTYLKGFLRIYATYLGLNADDMARMYDKLYGAKDAENDQKSSRPERVRPAFRIASLRKFVLPAGLLLLILITAALFKSHPAKTIRLPRNDATPPIPSVSAVQSTSSSVKVRKVVPKTEKPDIEPGADTASSAEKIPLSIKSADAGGGFILKITVTQNGSVNVALDDSAPHSYQLIVGDIIELKAQRTVSLDLSNAGGVDVELNGKPIKKLGPSGKPAYVILDADGIEP